MKLKTEKMQISHLIRKVILMIQIIKNWKIQLK